MYRSRGKYLHPVGDVLLFYLPKQDQFLLIIFIYYFIYILSYQKTSWIKSCKKTLKKHLVGAEESYVLRNEPIKIGSLN